jgi:hypothetical protein
MMEAEAHTLPRPHNPLVAFTTAAAVPSCPDLGLAIARIFSPKSLQIRKIDRMSSAHNHNELLCLGRARPLEGRYAHQARQPYSTWYLQNLAACVDNLICAHRTTHYFQPLYQLGCKATNT